MATFTKVRLSGSTSGAPIKVGATTSPGTAIHSTGTSASVIDEIWLYAYNSSTATQLLTIQFGGTTSVDNDIRIFIPSQSGLTLIVPGLLLSGTGSAANNVLAYASTTNVVTVSGYVNRIS